MQEHKSEEHPTDQKQKMTDEVRFSTIPNIPPQSGREPMIDPLALALLFLLAGSFVYVSFFSVPVALQRGGEFFSNLTESVSVSDFVSVTVPANDGSENVLEQRKQDVETQFDSTLPAYVYPYPLEDAIEPLPDEYVRSEMRRVSDFTIHAERQKDSIVITWPKGVGLRAAYLVSRYSGSYHHLFGWEGGEVYTNGRFDADLPPFLPPDGYVVLAYTDDPSGAYVYSDLTQLIVIKDQESGFLAFRGMDTYNMVYTGDQGAAVKVIINDPALSLYPHRSLAVDLVPRTGARGAYDVPGSVSLYESGYFRAPGSAYTQVVFPMNIPEDLSPGEYDIRATLRYRMEDSEKEQSYSFLHAVTVATAAVDY